MKNLVVKDNALIEASYKLSLVEQRLILMARQFTFIDIVDGKKIKKTSRWVSEIGYGVNEAVVTMKFAPAIMPLISELERRFTSYSLDRIASLNSAYAVRLYELLIQWRSTGLTPLIKLDDLRQKLGVEKNEYPRMTDFKKRVLDLGIEQINEHTDITAKYKQIKKGREIVGFEFSFKEKSKPIDSTSKAVERDPNTADMFTQLTDKQLARIVHSKKFINDYNGLVSAQNPANQSSGAWVAHMVEWLKKDPSNFAKRPMQEYLDDEQAQRF